MNMNELPMPFLGRLLLEVISEDPEQVMRRKLGMENSKLALPDSMTKSKKIPYKKGIIQRMASDAFGDAFQNRYGADGDKLSIGDTVWFVPNESYVLDEEGKYHMISDQDIVGYTRAEQQKEEETKDE